jgi:DNA-binding NarL/FixJ family response regulator
VLAAAEVYQDAREDRAHRAALSRADTRALLLDEVARGRLDASAVEGVLVAAGHHPRRRASSTAGLSVREIEVLQLLVRGLSNTQIAAQLTVSARTVGSHVEHIYTKIGASTRGSAAMYAMRNGLVDARVDDAPMPKRSGE